MDNEAQGTINRRVAMHIKRRVSGWLTLAVFAVGGAMVASDPAFAKVDMDNLTIGGEARIRYEGRINTAFSSNVKSNESAGSSRIRVNVGYDLTPDISFFAQIQDARNWGNEGCRTESPDLNFGSTFNGGCSNTGIGAVSSSNKFGTGLDLHQGYILVKNVGVQGLSLKIGRQEMFFGDHRLFGNFNWSNIGNSFVAVRLTHSMPIADVDVFWALIIDSVSGIAFTGSGSGGSNAGTIFPNLTNSTNTQDVYGLYVTLKAVPNWTVEPYYFLLKDSRVFAGNISGGNLTAFSPQAPDQARNVLGG